MSYPYLVSRGSAAELPATERYLAMENHLARWPDFLPDVAHLVGWALVIALSVFLLPFPSRSVILAGLILTSGTYFLPAALRGALSGLEADT
jgi:hypothetical protein